MTVVEAVGARLRPQASSETETSRTSVEPAASEEVRQPVKLMTGISDAGEDGEQTEDLFGLAGVGEGEDEVAGGDHAEVAVEGFGGVEEEGGGAGGAEGGGDLAGDDAGLADAGEGDAAAGLERGAEVEGAVECGAGGAVEAVGEVVQGGGFDADVVGGVNGVVGHGSETMLAEEAKQETAAR